MSEETVPTPDTAPAMDVDWTRLNKALLVAAYRELIVHLERDLAWTQYARGVWRRNGTAAKIVSLCVTTIPALREALHLPPDPDLEVTAAAYGYVG